MLFYFSCILFFNMLTLSKFYGGYKMKDDVFSLTIGDFHLYRHSCRYIFAIKVNESLDNIKKAYFDSIDLSKVSFTKHVDNTAYSFAGLDKSHGNYLNYTLSNDVVEKLLAVGLNPHDDKYMYDAVHEYDEEYGDDPIYLFDGDENFVNLLMDFIKLSLPHLEYSILDVTDKTKHKIPNFNTLDNGQAYDIGYMFEFENCYVFNQ